MSSLQAASFLLIAVAVGSLLRATSYDPPTLSPDYIYFHSSDSPSTAATSVQSFFWLLTAVKPPADISRHPGLVPIHP